MTSFGPHDSVSGGPFRTHVRGAPPKAHAAPEASSTAPGNRPGASGPDPVRIRKYPNRRLYDTSRSRHLTHEGVVDLIREGRSVHVTDSRSGADITNVVLLQILIEKEPAKLAALPAWLLHRAMRITAAEIGAAAAEMLDRSAATGVRRPSAGPSLNGAVQSEDAARPKARAKREDELPRTAL